MLLLANHDENTFRVRGIRVPCFRGQIGFTSEKLALRWKWSRGKVMRFLNGLQTDGMIVQQKNNVTTLITILNYDKYQGSDTADSTANGQQTIQQIGQQTVQQTDINKNDKECIKNDKEEIKRGEGDFQPPHAPPISGLHILPDGRSYIEPTIIFSKADFNGLPDQKNAEIVRFLKVTKGVTREPTEISELWESFKEMELTNQKPYRNKDDVYRHFLNWTKKQTFKKGVATKKAVTAKPQKAEKIHGITFLNDFKECKMSDGSTYDLTQNESDSARYNLINPSSIVKNA